LTQKNSTGRINGEVLEYRDGKIIMREKFVDGLREGWRILYYLNGQVKKKTFCKHDKADGKEYSYYINGTLMYSGVYRNGIPYGSLFWYDDLGKILSYTLYDINGRKTFKVDYNNRGAISHMHGFIVSADFYSKDIRTDSVVILDKTRRTNVRDLYIVMATPPNASVVLNLKVNNLEYKNIRSENCTLVIKNALLLKNRNKISLESHLLDLSNKEINGININSEVLIE